MDEQTKQKRKDIVGWVIYIAVLLAIIITFRCFLMIGRVPSESMEPTLMVHDWLIGDRHAYEEEKPQRGDIVMFYQKDENETMVKRVIGLPGETVSFVGGKVYINGEPLDESAYLDDTVETDCGEEDKTFTVPEGSYFMLGDNREISLDARYWKHTYIEYTHMPVRCQDTKGLKPRKPVKRDDKDFLRLHVIRCNVTRNVCIEGYFVKRSILC